MMTNGRRIVAAARSLVVGGLMSSRTQSDLTAAPHSATKLAPVLAVTPSPSATPSTLSPAEQNSNSAESAAVRFWRVVDRLAADPNSKLEELTTDVKWMCGAASERCVR